MSLLRIKKVVPVGGYRLQLTLTDGSTLERDVEKLLTGPVFESIRSDPDLFRQVRVEHGTLTWPGEVDLCSDVLIWQGPPPSNGESASIPKSFSS
jgi:hypothetical protein